MKIAFYDPYIPTLGGGERYVLTLASHLSTKADVTILWDDPDILKRITERLAIDLSHTTFSPSPFSLPLWEKARVMSRYDLLFFLSDGSLPFSFSKRTFVHFQVPFHFNGRSLLNRLKLARVEKVICNSRFTKGFIDETYGVNSAIVYPPVSVSSFSKGQKENVILSVGRFSSTLHPKRQDFMITAFKELCDKGLGEWKLVLIGGSVPEDKEFIGHLRDMALGYPVEIIENAPFSILQSYYSKAKVYWHATGYGVPVNEHPEQYEHFGITTVEAMAAGCVPIVIGQGGQVEIVDDGVNGYLWNDMKKLKEMTSLVCGDDRLFGQLSKEAMAKAVEFDSSVFCKAFDDLLFGVLPDEALV